MEGWENAMQIPTTDDKATRGTSLAEDKARQYALVANTENVHQFKFQGIANRKHSRRKGAIAMDGKSA